MGLFGKKKTTTQVITEKVTGTKIVKLSYVESILLNEKIASAAELGGVTKPSETKSANSSEIKKFNGTAFAIGFATTGPLALIGAGTGLFGKKRTVDTNVNIKESGWTLVKTWAQPEFDVIRYALGIKEIGVAQFLYENASEMISKPWVAAKEIVKLSMVVDQFIPSNFPAGTFIEYYVKPDIQDFKWIRINPIDLPTQYTAEGTVVPRIISFNSERPISARQEETYITTTSPVTSVRVRIVMKRPSSVPESYSPIVKSYKLIMTPRGGL